MAAIRILETSIEYLTARVTAITPSDLTSFGVDIAVVATGTLPDDVDFVEAEWEGTDQAKVLIGPTTDLVLADGIYEVFVRVDTGIEAVTMMAGRLTIV